MHRAPNPWDRFYRRHEAPWRGETRIADLRPSLGAGPVLELGCGNGKTLRPLLRAGIPVVGLDISWHALRRLAPVGRGGLLLADAQALPLASGTMTAVLDLHCTGHLEEAGRALALAEAWRVLRPGGVLVQERLGPLDLRAVGTGASEAVPGTAGARGEGGGPEQRGELEGGGEPEGPGEPEQRVLADGRATVFLPPEALRRELEAAGFDVGDVQERVIRPRIRGQQVVRQSLRVAARRPV